MLIAEKPFRTIWSAEDGRSVEIIDQTRLPFELVIARLRTLEDAARAIRDMQVRGAPLIGVAAAYGLWLGLRECADEHHLARIAETLIACRPTAVNLRWAVERVRARLETLPSSEWPAAALAEARRLADEDVATNAAIGRHGLALIEELHRRKGAPVNILTHCNAGWLATVDWGTALAPIYAAFRAGIPLHVWVDETRPRNQGASLTAWELAQEGIPHHLVADNAGGHLMQHGQVDLCLVGSDRTTAEGDVCNKIGTYLKALAAKDNKVPFYVALPGSTVDWRLRDGVAEIPIEERNEREVLQIRGCADDGQVLEVRLAPEGTPACNPAFDVTPARLVTGLITERGICAASREGLRSLYPENVL
jgi:methylthioribose-1-phosphate isomerase